jgi:hypothetical protein
MRVASMGITWFLFRAVLFLSHFLTPSFFFILMTLRLYLSGGEELDGSFQCEFACVGVEIKLVFVRQRGLVVVRKK